MGHGVKYSLALLRDVATLPDPGFTSLLTLIIFTVCVTSLIPVSQNDIISPIHVMFHLHKIELDIFAILKKYISYQ